MERAWWKEAVFYQIYPKSFRDSNGDGIGDLNGIREKLGYLKALGVNALWICPFYASPMADNGYDISDYEAIHPDFGTMEDCEALIAEAKAQGMRIIMDMVINHTSDRHEWFRQACADRNSPYRDFYIFRDSIDGLADLRSCFGGSTWTQIPDGSWYFHTFAPEQPDLNWENPQMRKALYAMIDRWLARGIAGFRMDAITYIKKDQRFPKTEPDGPDGRTSVWSVATNVPGIGEYLTELRDATYGRGDYTTVAEAPGVPADQLPEYIGKNGYFSMVFDFSYTDIDLTPGKPWIERHPFTTEEFRKALFANQYAVKSVGWAANYLENHDQPRSIDKYFPAEDVKLCRERMAKALGALFFFLRGTPFIYQGEELGMVNTRFGRIEELDDINSKGEYARCLEEGYTPNQALASINRRSRDHARLPMQWSEGEEHGFSDHAPWLGYNNAVPEISADAEMKDPASVWSWYRDMIALRSRSEYREILIYGGIEEESSGDPDVIRYSRTLDGKTVHVAVNMGARRVPARMPGLLMKACPESPDALEPYDAAIWA